MKNIYLFLFFLLGSVQYLSAQYTIIGQVQDASTKTTLPLANIIYNDSIVIVADEDGFFSITADTITSFQVFYLGYDNYETALNWIDSDTITLSIYLQLSSSILNTIVVTGSNYEKNILEEPTSIEVIQPLYIQNNNITSLDKLIERVPGIQVLDGQASIRSSGFSQGAGSRVGIIINGLPMLGGENNSIQWNFMPIENIDQIEVIKGAASVLYGSAAMNGVINVRTAWPSDKPYTNLTLYGGASDSPREKYRQWWNETEETPHNRGIFLSHRQKFGKLDVVLGGNIHQDISHIKGNDEDRKRGHLNLRYRANERLTFQLSGNVMNHFQMPYLSWEDGDTNVLRSLDSLVADQYYNLSIDPSITYFDKKDGRHILRGRYYNTVFERLNGERIPVYMSFAEYQYRKGFYKNNLFFTGGISNQYYFAQSPNFGIDTTTNEFVTTTASLNSIYGQGDFSFLDKKLNFILGIRWEFIDAKVEDYPILPPIIRFSSTYKITPKDIVRFSLGQGYRIPSLAERFIDRDLARVVVPPTIDFFFGIMPNPDLRPEYGWSTELGYKKGIDKNNWKGYFDVAAFATRYRDMIYLTLDFHSDEVFDLPTLIENLDLLGYKYINLENTLIAGIEVSTNLEGKIGPIPFKVWAGYTYTYPGNLDSIRIRNENYLENFAKAFTLNDQSVLPSILTNRSTHVARFDIEFYLKKLTLGFSANYDGYLHNIDPVLEGKGAWGEFIASLGTDLLLPGVVDFRNNNPKDNVIFDVKLGYKINKNHQLNAIVSNLGNRTYATRPGRMNAFRTFNLKYTLTL